MPSIHPTAIVNASARIADDVAIGPYSIVEAEVAIGPGCVVGAHVTLGERLSLGARVQVFNYACLGTASQDLKHRGEISSCEIGDDSIIREFVTVNRATRERGVTRVGAGVALLAYSHVAHECQVGDGAILVNGATLGGEVVVGSRAVIGGLVGVHQFCRIGRLAIIGACSKVVQDIPPFCIADGHPARPFGPNKIGLERSGFTPEQIEEVRTIWRLLYAKATTREKALARLAKQLPDSALARETIDFCTRSLAAGGRGIAHPREETNGALGGNDAPPDFS